LAALAIESHEVAFQAASATQAILAIRTAARGHDDRLRDAIDWPPAPTEAWARGFLAGIFDADGSYRGGVLRITSTDWTIVEIAVASLRRFGLDAIVTTSGTPPAYDVRVGAGVR